MPAVDAFNLGGPAPHLGVDFLAQLALLTNRDRLHDKLHATCFANTIFAVAVLPEVTPLPVTANETMLIEEAHVSRAGLFLRYLGWVMGQLIGPGKAETSVG